MGKQMEVSNRSSITVMWDIKPFDKYGISEIILLTKRVYGTPLLPRVAAFTNDSNCHKADL